MALVKFGGGIVGMSGSIAGNTFARNRYGNYVRARTKPINPNTDLQNAVRSAVAYLAERWSATLTAIQRAAWGDYAAGISMKNKLGEATFLSGFNHFIRSNAERKRNTSAVVDAGPTTLSLPDKDAVFAITASAATQLISVAFDDTLDWLSEEGAFMYLYQGKPQLPTRNYFGGPWKTLPPIAGVVLTPPTTPQTVAPSFVITEAQRIWVYGKISRADGRLSEKFAASCIVAA